MAAAPAARGGSGGAGSSSGGAGTAAAASLIGERGTSKLYFAPDNLLEEKNKHTKYFGTLRHLHAPLRLLHGCRARRGSWPPQQHPPPNNPVQPTAGPPPAWLRLFGLAILPRRLAAALRRRLGRDQEVSDVGHPRPAVAEEYLPDAVSWLVYAGWLCVCALRVDMCTGQPGRAWLSTHRTCICICRPARRADSRPAVAWGRGASWGTCCTSRRRAPSARL